MLIAEMWEVFWSCVVEMTLIRPIAEAQGSQRIAEITCASRFDSLRNSAFGVYPAVVERDVSAICLSADLSTDSRKIFLRHDPGLF